MRAVYQRKQLHTFSLLSNLIGYLKLHCLQPARSHAFGCGWYKPHLHWVLPMSGFNNVLSIFAQSQGLVTDTHRVFKVLPSEPSLVIKLDALNTEFQYHPAQGFRIQYLEGMQTISPSPLHRERIECPATKGAEDILGEGLSRKEEEVQAFHFNLGMPNTIYREECKKCLA